MRSRAPETAGEPWGFYAGFLRRQIAGTLSSMPLDYVAIGGFRSIGAARQVALRPINLLVGANGSGKSNFVAAFQFLNSIVEGKLQDYVRRSGGADKILYFGAQNTRSITLSLSFDGEVNKYEVSLGVTEDDSLYLSKEIIYFWDRARYPKRYNVNLSPSSGGREAGISKSRFGGARSGVVDYVQQYLDSWRIYHVHDTSSNSPMRTTARLNDNRFLRSDGSNLAAFLFRLKTRTPECYDIILRTIRSVTPFFGDFLLQPDPLNEETIRLAWTHRDSDQYFDASALSDGSLRFIVLATLFLQPEELRPSVILVDEPELGLHPYAVTVLASLIKQASFKTQVIIATQSTLLLDHFEPEDVLVAERTKGGTEITRLDAERLGAWLEEYSLGQLWEKNEFGGRPTRE
jgi:predicted ATPase